MLSRAVVSGVCAWAWLLGGAALDAVAAPAVGRAPADCFASLRQPTGSRLVCAHHAWMTEDERADLTKLTRGYLLDAKCTVSVDVDRKLIDEGLAASDRTFEMPAQPVVCALETSGGPMTISGTFAPKVMFKEGFAVDATPGLANVTGVNSYLAWPVVAYVNGSARVKTEMAAMINLFRARLNKRQQASLR